MPRIVNDKELNAVTALTAPERYSYFIKQVADSETIWSLGDDSGWVLTGDNQGDELVPIWPHERYASSCATGKWANAVPREIELQRWIEDWIPGMLNDGRQIAVFPTPEGRGIVVDPNLLKK